MHNWQHLLFQQHISLFLKLGSITNNSEHWSFAVVMHGHQQELREIQQIPSLLKFVSQIHDILVRRPSFWIFLLLSPEFTKDLVWSIHGVTI